ncbi:MAG: hypothetical protein QM736_07215 [Vicinamibacterales bacterium]
MGCYQAWNDASSGTLNIGTYAASADRRGATTSFRITNLPNANAVRITVDGQPFTRFEVTDSTTIRIDTTIDNRRYRIVTGYRGADRRADEQPRQQQPPRAAAHAGSVIAQQSIAAHVDRNPTRNLFSAKGVGCACCQS